MASFGPRVPINYISTNGFDMIVSLNDTLRQNFKMLLLTNPGERIMEPEFGVGIQQYLFLNYSENVEQQIKNKIVNQVSLYMPFITITDLNFESSPDYNKLNIRIGYSIPSVGGSDLLEFTI